PGQPGTPKPPAPPQPPQPPQPPEVPQPPTGAGRGAGQELRIELEKAIGAEVKNIRAEIANAGAGVRGVRFDVSPSVGSGGARPRLGIRGEAPSAILIDQLNLPKHRGLVIVDVRPDSAAAKAGIKVNDVLLKVGDNLVTNDSAAFGKLTEGLKPG